MSFPKTIHFMWFQGVQNAPDGLGETPKMWQRVNPGWDIREWDEHSLREHIREHYSSWLAEWEDLPSVIKKCDLGRLFVIHHFGGVYADMDLLPLTPMDTFLDSGTRRFMQWKPGMRSLRDEDEHAERVDYHAADVILSREYRPIDVHGHGIANGIIIAKPKSEFLLRFIESRRGAGKLEVLKAFGPWALTYFVRQNFELAQQHVRVVPPMYLLWEDPSFDHSPPAWVVCKHLAKNYWGEHSKKQWWLTH